MHFDNETVLYIVSGKIWCKWTCLLEEWCNFLKIYGYEVAFVEFVDLDHVLCSM
ncbi:hypothetical protein Lalb_Chr10g0094221 [Lupinus albus]|uniref:Uncharacterized protein n=1 Tax=Lupinus albus TaxID=3870 RepID=A0A6A4PTZ0_LUPAL|nr:hypothetical protein Lalb_Chr10g0094221 [Lupinus albus]